MSNTEAFEKLQEASELLSKPQFVAADAMAISNATRKALEHLLDPKRNIVQLSGHHVSPGTGRRRMFTGEDILAIKTAFVMSGIGFPQRWSYLLVKEVTKRAWGRISGLATPGRFALATYPQQNGDWAYVPIIESSLEKQKLPVAAQYLDVDRLIDETFKQLEAIVSDTEIPDFSVPDIIPEASPWTPENDFFRMWAKDDEDRDIRVGLSFEETQELIALEEGPSQEREQLSRYLELSDKHEAARMDRIMHESEDRQEE